MEDLYPSETAAAETPPESDTETPASDSVDEETEEAPSALLPKSAFGDGELKEGQTITLRVVKDYGDEVEVCACGGDTPKPKKSMMASADEEIDAMDKES